jgi:hypothetical protein
MLLMFLCVAVYIAANRDRALMVAKVIGSSTSSISAGRLSEAQESPAVAANSASKLTPGLLSFRPGSASPSSSAIGQKKPLAPKLPPLPPFDSSGAIKAWYEKYVAARKDPAAAVRTKVTTRAHNFSELEVAESKFKGAIYFQIWSDSKFHSSSRNSTDVSLADCRLAAVRAYWELSRLDDAGAREVGQRYVREIVDSFATDHLTWLAGNPDKRKFAIQGIIDWITNGNGIDRDECSVDDQLACLNSINIALHEHFPGGHLADHVFAVVKAQVDDVFNAMDAIKARTEKLGLKAH